MILTVALTPLLVVTLGADIRSTPFFWLREVASLNTAITDASEIIVIGDGPAGKLWRIRGAFKQSGAAHGQLECYHYLLLAQNNAGGLSHIEYLPRVAQPWGDVSSPAAAR